MKQAAGCIIAKLKLYCYLIFNKSSNVSILTYKTLSGHHINNKYFINIIKITIITCLCMYA